MALQHASVVAKMATRKRIRLVRRRETPALKVHFPTCALLSASPSTVQAFREVDSTECESRLFLLCHLMARQQQHQRQSRHPSNNLLSTHCSVYR